MEPLSPPRRDARPGRRRRLTAAVRIAYVAGTAPPSRVASAVNVLEMCRSFAAGHEVTLYYMAAGKPILASDIPALREILRDGDTALLLPPGEPDAWAAARGLLRDRERAVALGARARAALLAEYTWDARATRILERLRGAAA